MGLSYLIGRAPRRARLAAMLDALAQDPGHRARLECTLMAFIVSRMAEEDRTRAADAAATKVDFFTLVRGEG